MRKILLASAAFLTASVATAQDVPGQVQVGKWLVGPLNADSCQAEGRFDDHYLLNVSEDSLGNGHLIFADDLWMLKEGDVKPFTYSWDGWKTTKQGNFTAVAAPSGKFFLTMEINSNFSEDMAGSKGLWLRVPGVAFDNYLEIPNAGDIAMAISACNSKH